VADRTTPTLDRGDAPWLRHRRRFVALCAIVVALNALIVGVSLIAIDAVDIGRAYVTGEGQYSKAQKSALIKLQQFVYTGDVRRYEEFRELLRVPTGDRLAREALLRSPADFRAARKGFLEGRIPGDDIFGMSLAFYTLKSWSPVAKAISDWREGDSLIQQLLVLGQQSYQTIAIRHEMSETSRFTARITDIDHRLTTVESDFSARMRNVAHLVRLFAVECLLALSIALLGAAVLAMWRISRSAMQSERMLHQSNRDLVEAKFRAEEADHAKSMFLANMSHELRTPLNAVIGYSEMMMAESLGPMGNRRYVQYATDIREAGTHLLALINDILDLSRIEAGKLELRSEWLDLAELLASAVTLTRDQAEKNGHVLAVTEPPERLTVEGDKLRLTQILLNLVSNSVKFTPSGGRIEVGAGLQPDQSLEFWVRDNGIGMNEEQVALAMQPFSQVDHTFNRKNQGAGLGLPITKKLVELHGGTLTIESKPEAGTTVRITLPARSVVRASRLTPQTSGGRGTGTTGPSRLRASA
jgi:signal transduction histidine kinase